MFYLERISGTHYEDYHIGLQQKHQRALNIPGHRHNKVLDFLQEVEVWYGVELGLQMIAPTKGRNINTHAKFHHTRDNQIAVETL
jgi:hypothetical protein